jgi:undecaprenyl diphosphate synthase
MSIPQHVAIIPDGDRRWAVRHAVDFATGYLKGMDTLEAIVKAAVSKNIPYLSFWVLAHENENRTSEWKSMFFGLLKKYLRPKCESMFAQNIGVKIIGDWKSLDSIKNDIETILKNSPTQPKMTVVFFLRYSGSRDLEQAVAQLITQNDDPRNIKNYLQTRQADIPDPDLLIRTSNVTRLSDYSMIQCANTELYFVDKLWPDFTSQDFDDALDWHAQVERRFGR